MKIFGWLLVYSQCILGSAAGLFLIACGIFHLSKIYSCNKIVDGCCVAKNRTWKIRRWYTSYTFSYRFDGKEYCSESKYGVTKELFEYLRQGEMYTIYVNEKKPEIFVVERKITFNEILEISMGAVFLAAAVYEFLKIFFW